MSSVGLFRVLVVTSVLLYLTWVTLPLLIGVSSLEMEAILSWNGYGASSWIESPWFYLSTGVSKIVASIGLFFFLSWGRWLFLMVHVIVFASIPFSGVSVVPPIDNIVGFLLTLSDGAILALSFALRLNNEVSKEA